MLDLINIYKQFSCMTFTLNIGVLYSESHTAFEMNVIYFGHVCLASVSTALF